MCFDVITPSEVLDTIYGLKNSKSSDIYHMNTELIKACAEFIANPLCNIFQACVAQGVFPNKLKISKTIPLFKKGDRKNMNCSVLAPDQYYVIRHL